MCTPDFLRPESFLSWVFQRFNPFIFETSCILSHAIAHISTPWVVDELKCLRAFSRPHVLHRFLLALHPPHISRRLGSAKSTISRVYVDPFMEHSPYQCLALATPRLYHPSSFLPSFPQRNHSHPRPAQVCPSRSAPLLSSPSETESTQRGPCTYTCPLGHVFYPTLGTYVCDISLWHTHTCFLFAINVWG